MANLRVFSFDFSLSHIIGFDFWITFETEVSKQNTSNGAIHADEKACTYLKTVLLRRGPLPRSPLTGSM